MTSTYPTHSASLHRVVHLAPPKPTVMIGPWTQDEKEWEGESIFILRAHSMAHTTEVEDADPIHKAGMRQLAYSEKDKATRPFSENSDPAS